jgi:hypothetical protein
MDNFRLVEPILISTLLLIFMHMEQMKAKALQRQACVCAHACSCFDL